jgi:hypothetical protein
VANNRLTNQPLTRPVTEGRGDLRPVSHFTPDIRLLQEPVLPDIVIVHLCRRDIKTASKSAKKTFDNAPFLLERRYPLHVQPDCHNPYNHNLDQPCGPDFARNMFILPRLFANSIGLCDVDGRRCCRLLPENHREDRCRRLIVPQGIKYMYKPLKFADIYHKQ